MMIVVWVILFRVGFTASAFTWRPLRWIIPIVLCFTVLSDFRAVSRAAQEGRDESYRWAPFVIVGDVALTSALWFAAYSVGYFFGRRKRQARHDAGIF